METITNPFTNRPVNLPRAAAEQVKKQVQYYFVSLLLCVSFSFNRSVSVAAVSIHGRIKLSTAQHCNALIFHYDMFFFCATKFEKV